MPQQGSSRRSRPLSGSNLDPAACEQQHSANGGRGSCNWQRGGHLGHGAVQEHRREGWVTPVFLAILALMALAVVIGAYSFA